MSCFQSLYISFQVRPKTSDTCNCAQKIRRFLTEMIVGSYDYDCMHHLRNVWFGGVEKKLNVSLNILLRSSLDIIDPKLRVTASISAIIRAVDKEFNLSANYPKGHGELFLEWMRANHPGELLLHVERAAGSRQDLCTEGCMAIYMNYPYYIEFLDMSLRKPKATSKIYLSPSRQVSWLHYLDFYLSCMLLYAFPVSGWLVRPMSLQDMIGGRCRWDE